MAKFTSDMYVALSLQKISELTAEDYRQVLMPAAEVYLESQRRWLNENTKGTGKLAESLQIEDKTEVGSVFIAPKGRHHGKKPRPKTKAAGYHRPKTGMGTSHLRKHHGMSGAVSATDVGYYLEFGTPRMPARHWMETANEQAGPEAQKVMDQAWDELLKSKGL